MSKFFRHLSLSLCLLLGAAGAAMAQSTTNGAIGGVIKDPQGAVVPGAAVTARSNDTGREGTATSDDEGRFQIVELPPGNYTLTVNATGFAAFTAPRVVVEVGRVTSLDIPLGVAGSA